MSNRQWEEIIRDPLAKLLNRVLGVPVFAVGNMKESFYRSAGVQIGNDYPANADARSLLRILIEREDLLEDYFSITYSETRGYALLLYSWLSGSSAEDPLLCTMVLFRFLKEIRNSGIDFQPSTYAFIAELEYDLESETGRECVCAPLIVDEEVARITKIFA
jgi:hypothetical protein